MKYHASKYDGKTKYIFYIYLVFFVLMFFVGLTKIDVFKKSEPLPIFGYTINSTVDDVRDSLYPDTRRSKRRFKRDNVLFFNKTENSLNLLFKEMVLFCDLENNYSILVKDFGLEMETDEFGIKYIMIELPRITKREDNTISLFEYLDCLVKHTNPVKIRNLKDIKDKSTPYIELYEKGKYNELCLAKTIFKKDEDVGAILMYYNSNFENQALEKLKYKKVKLLN